MNTTDQSRLAEIRAQAIKMSVLHDTSRWDTPYLLSIIDRQAREIRELRK